VTNRWVFVRINSKLQKLTQQKTSRQTVIHGH